MKPLASAKGMRRRTLPECYGNRRYNHSAMIVNVKLKRAYRYRCYPTPTQAAVLPVAMSLTL
jgi:Helix-turn-helix domain